MKVTLKFFGHSKMNNKFIIQYQITDECTFCFDGYRIVEAESVDHIKLAFVDELEKAVNKNHCVFDWLDIEFKVSTYVYTCNGVTVWDDVDVMTPEEYLHTTYKI